MDLLTASEYGHLDVVKYLIEDVKVETKTLTKSRLSPLHIALINNCYNIVKILIQQKAIYRFKAIPSRIFFYRNRKYTLP